MRAGKLDAREFSAILGNRRRVHVTVSRRLVFGRRSESSGGHRRRTHRSQVRTRTALTMRGFGGFGGRSLRGLGQAICASENHAYVGVTGRRAVEDRRGEFAPRVMDTGVRMPVEISLWGVHVRTDTSIQMLLVARQVFSAADARRDTGVLRSNRIPKHPLESLMVVHHNRGHRALVIAQHQVGVFIEVARSLRGNQRVERL